MLACVACGAKDPVTFGPARILLGLVTISGSSVKRRTSETLALEWQRFALLANEWRKTSSIKHDRTDLASLTTTLMLNVGSAAKGFERTASRSARWPWTSA